MIRAAPLCVTILLSIAPSVRAQSTAVEYEEACDYGDLVDCSVVGLIYQTGATGTRDVDRAVDLYERACQREVTSACRRLDLLAEAGSDTLPSDDRVRVGYVADAYDGAPLGGAVVRVRGIAGIGERRYLSDAAGRVVLDPLPYGTHTIDVQRGGYTGARGEIPVPWDGEFLILLEQVVVQDEPSSSGRIFGQVTDEGSGTAISEVDVTVTAGGTSRTISNRQGRFLLEDMEPGRVEIRFERLGYEPRTTTVTVQGGRTLEVYATMSARPVELEPVQVSVASPYLERSGFYRRAHVPGDRFTFRDIEELSPVLVADILRRVAGVTVVTSQIGSSSAAVSNRRSGGDPLGRCRLQPYYNGTPLQGFELELLPPDEIEALEVYQGANVPIEYLDTRQIDGPSCGVILIWTRDPRRTR